MSLLTVDDIHVSFSVGPLRRAVVRAVAGVSFVIERGETFGLVGESGSGKTTTGRAILDLVPVDRGSIVYAGRDIGGADRAERLAYRKAVQVVFQDPYSSLNPRLRVGAAIGELVGRFTNRSGAAVGERVAELLEEVGLHDYHADRFPHQFSGGQRQRVAIARALATEPDLIICDEPVSALDVSTQSQVINLLADLQDLHGLSLLFISHGLSVVRHVSDRIGVMYLGRLVETGRADEVYTQPRHPYTAALLAAIPVPDPTEQRRRRAASKALNLDVEPPSPTSPPAGCAFHPRCPFVMDVCRTTAPEPFPTGTGEVHCHLHSTGPTLSGQSVLELTDAPI